MFRRPGWLLAACIVLLLPVATGLRWVVKDPSVDAFVPLDHPAAEARDRARELFGLDDPIVIGFQASPGTSVWTPPILEALRGLHEAVRLLPGVIKADVVSVASERSIRGDGGELLVELILPEGPVTAESSALARERLHAMPMFLDVLGARDDSVLTIIVPVEDPNHATGLYDAVLVLATELAPAGVQVHVAGVAAMNARLAYIVDSDTRIFVPAAVLTVLVILLLALRRPLAVIGPLFVIAASAAFAIGLMGWLGARYYLITTALPVVIMAIAVADSLHLSTWYLRHRTSRPEDSATTAVRAALAHTWLPITLTTVTTVAAFVGLSIGAAMQPISEFGLFAAVGVVAAWVFSLTALPAILILTDLRPVPVQPGEAWARQGGIDRVVAVISNWSLRHPAVMVSFMVAVVGVFLLFALTARFDYERKRYFQVDDPVRMADSALNDALGGLNFLDVTVAAPVPGGILTVPALTAIADLRARLAALPGVVKVTGIDDYIAVMHAALTDAEPGTLPTYARAPAQYMFLYEAASAPEDFKRSLDYDQQHALIRAHLASDRFSGAKPVVAELARLTTEWSAQNGLTATPGGRIAVNDGWMSVLADNHFRGLGLAAGLVLLAALIAFRALGPALLAMVPVCVGVLFVYATMGALAIDIAPATSMTAAIATGLGVDFGIHLIAHVRRRLAAGASLEEALSGQYLVVGRACFYSALALGVALAVVCLSGAPPLRWFGVLVSAGAFGSLVGALLILPGVLALTQPHADRRLQNA